MKGYRGPNSVQRRNDAMFAMFERAKNEGRGLVGDSGMKSKSKALKKAKK